ncbi:MAG: pro-sigmaK processing inhibitor BofA family protein [Methanomicrobiales archaeon]|nr:pro-sigmaK processing inhibitor BofA family protein [Methanomicrobiales archaeon]
MDILGSIVSIVLAIIVLLILYYVIKKFVALVINAIVGVIVLFLLNVFHVMSLFGAPDLPIDWITVLVSAIGGLVGVVIVVVLHLAGVAL